MWVIYLGWTLIAASNLAIGIAIGTIVERQRRTRRAQRRRAAAKTPN